MKKILLTLIIIMASVSFGFAASLKISELTETQTLTDDDLFLVSTYSGGSYTSQYIKKNYLVTTLGIINNASTLTVIDTTDASTYVALFDSATGDLAIKTDTKITFDATTGILTASGFIGPLTGAVTGNAGTATALAANPTDCGENAVATAIDASGNLTCSYSIGTNIQAYNADLDTISAGGTAGCLWGEKSDSSGIECKTTLNLQLDDSAAQFKSATASKGTLKFDQTGITNGKLVTVKFTSADDYTFTPTLLGNVSLSLGTTFTDTKYCTYSTSTGLTCAADGGEGAGDFKADGTVALTGAIVLNAANTIAVGSATYEFADLFLGDGAVINFGNDQDVTLTHNADTGLTTNLNFSAATISTTATATPNITFYDSDNAGADEETAKILVNAETTTDGSEDGKMSLQVMVDGTDTTYIDIDGKTATATITPNTSITGSLFVSGTIAGKMPMITKSGNYTLGSDNAQEAYGYIVWLTGDGTVLTLPAVTAGMSVCVYSADSYDKVVDPNGSDGIRNGTTTRNADGHKITSGATDQGSFVCLVADSSDGWTVLGKAGTWTDE